MGAHTTIARTVKETICEVEYVDENNKVQNAEITLYADYDIFGAVNPVRRKLGTKRAIVKSVRHRSYWARMSFEKFAELCEKSEIKEY